MRFSKIDQVILFGGSQILLNLAKNLQTRDHRVVVFAAPRHLEEPIGRNNATLGQELESSGISFHRAEDINQDSTLPALINDSTLGIGIGETWGFSGDLVQRFNGHLVDFMGIRMPHYRGGAHYSWQIMGDNRIGGCVLQLINEDMVPGEFDSGPIIKYKEYILPPQARIPQDYLNALDLEGVLFLEEFLGEIAQGKDFPFTSLQENFSLFFPRLNTLKQGYIDWSWSAEEVKSFICAFDDPYAGASTFVDGERVFLKKCHVEHNDGSFHPFQAGLVYRKTVDACFVAAKGGSIVIRELVNEDGHDAMEHISVGRRLYTPRENIEEAMLFQAEYGHSGPLEKN